MAFSPDGTKLASASWDKSGEAGGVKLWDVATGQNIATLQGHTDGGNSVAFSPDGTVLASGSYDETVKLWKVSTGQNIATLQGHRGAVYSVAFSINGTKIASGARGNFPEEGKLKLWDVETGRNLATLHRHTDGVYSVAFSPDGTVLASGDGDGTVKLWEVSTGRNINTLQEHRYEVKFVAFSPDGTLLASGANDGTILLWDMSSHITPITPRLQRPTMTETALLQNYPNPFNPETWMPYQLANDTDVQISIYDINGALVRQFALGHQKAGFYTYRTKAAYWDGRNEHREPVAARVYFYTLTTNDYEETRKMVILK